MKKRVITTKGFGSIVKSNKETILVTLDDGSKVTLPKNEVATFNLTKKKMGDVVPNGAFLFLNGVLVVEALIDSIKPLCSRNNRKFKTQGNTKKVAIERLENFLLSDTTWQVRAHPVSAFSGQSSAYITIKKDVSIVELLNFIDTLSMHKDVAYSIAPDKKIKF